MAEAARSGTKSQVQNNQRQAGEQLQKNQTGAAQQSQEKAAEALEQMLEDLDDADKNRDRALVSLLQDIANSIGGAYHASGAGHHPARRRQARGELRRARRADDRAALFDAGPGGKSPVRLPRASPPSPTTLTVPLVCSRRP